MTNTSKHRSKQFEPFANERDVLTLERLEFENRLDRVSLHGNVELTKDKVGLATARHLKAIVDRIVGVLEAEPSLPDSAPIGKPKSVKNPFG